ncbi:MAG: hypothetical protein J3Q66DRAFT_369112 [Benniella sp.]|nr:MAG: hypothetical protein J3Q66DRAFT_369112 [Benniella sp.]
MYTHNRLVYKDFPNNTMLEERDTEQRLVNAIHSKSEGSFAQDSSDTLHFDEHLTEQKSRAREKPLDIGTIHQRLSKGIKDNFHAENPSGLADYIESTIVEMAKLNTDLLRHDSIATQNYVNGVMSKHLSLDPSSTDNATRREKFRDIHTETGFFKSLVKILYNSNTHGSSPSYLAAVEAAQQFRLGDVIRTHVHAFILELKHRMQCRNQEWSKSPEGSILLQSIDEKEKSNLYDVITLFWTMNAHLPKKHQLKYIPESGFSDSFCYISESQLIQVILRQTTANKVIRGELTKIFDGSKDAQRRSLLFPGVLIKKARSTNRGTGIDTLENLPATNDEYKKSKEATKASLEQYLKGLNSNIRPGKFVLAGTIATNGHDLRAHAYSLNAPKGKKDDINDHKGTDTNRGNKGRYKMPYIRNAITGTETRQGRTLSKGRSVICQNPLYGGFARNRDHNAGEDIAQAMITWLQELKWPEAMDRKMVFAQAP